MTMTLAADSFTKFYDVALLAGACEKKARYFANKETYKKHGVNLFQTLGMTKKSAPTRDEVLYCITESDGVTANDLVTEYPFIRMKDVDLIKMIDGLVDDDLVEFNDGFYRGVA